MVASNSSQSSSIVSQRSKGRKPLTTHADLSYGPARLTLTVRSSGRLRAENGARRTSSISCSPTQFPFHLDAVFTTGEQHFDQRRATS